MRKLSRGKIIATVVGLVVLAVMAVIAVVAGGDDDESTSGSETTETLATLPSGPVSDEDVASALLPVISALGPDWIETQRDDTATEAQPTPGDACPSGPVPEGHLIRSEQQRVQGGNIVESLSVTAGVVAEGAEPADLEDPTVVSCLLDGLQAQLPAGSTVAAVEGPEISEVPAGAIVGHQRYEVTGSGGTGGTFDFVSVRRGRLVSLGLLSGFDPSVHTDLEDVIAVLDQPVAAAAARLD